MAGEDTGQELVIACGLECGVVVTVKGERFGSVHDGRMDEGAVELHLAADGVLIVRRSQTVGDEVMEQTKTGVDQRISLPLELLALLRLVAFCKTPLRMSSASCGAVCIGTDEALLPLLT